MAEKSSYTQEMLQREALLLGTDVVSAIGELRVIVFGVGGVGGWCAESLVRSGIRHLTIVDNDMVNISNANRQLVATSKTMGRVKVEALRERLTEINPEADITALAQTYNKESAESFHLEQYDYVIDAIDTLEHKAHLILHATRLGKEGKPTLFSSMGAALRINPFCIRQAEFWDVEGDPLARVLRKKFKKWDEYPATKFQCVYSTEQPMANKTETMVAAGEKRPNGTIAHVTATFGFALASLVINDFLKHNEAQ